MFSTILPNPSVKFAPLRSAGPRRKRRAPYLERKNGVGHDIHGPSQVNNRVRPHFPHSTVGVSTASSGAQWSQTTAISVGVSVDFCSNPPPSACEEPEEHPAIPDSASYGISRHLGVTVTAKGAVCLNVGISTPMPGSVSWDLPKK